MIIVGKLGLELEILVNMYKLLIEENISMIVIVKLNFGKISFFYEVLKKGDIDIYFEFIGMVIESLF